MAASYYVLGDWLPALHKTNAFYISSEATRPKINIPLLALGSFPFEVVLASLGIALFWKSDRRRSLSVYLGVLLTTFLIFFVVFKGQLPADGAGASRNLFSFVVLALPFVGFLLAQLLTSAQFGRVRGPVIGCLILLALGSFDVVRAFNYPAAFPRDAIYAGWFLRGLQNTGTIAENEKILIERAEDWGDLGIVALANRPERFVVLNELSYRQAALSGELANRAPPVAVSEEEGVRGNACEKGFRSTACTKSLLEEKFKLVVLSSPGRVVSFQETFHAPSWHIGRYHIFEMHSFRPSR
jgi:hypothetical protein